MEITFTNLYLTGYIASFLILICCVTGKDKWYMICLFPLLSWIAFVICVGVGINAGKDYKQSKAIDKLKRKLEQ